MSKLISLLQHVPLFQDLSVTELEAIAPLFVERKYKKGTILFFEGDAGDEFFLIHTGVVKIYRIDNSKEIILSLFREGIISGKWRSCKRASALGDGRNAGGYVRVRAGQVRLPTVYGAQPQAVPSASGSNDGTVRRANEKIYDLTFLGVRSRVVKTILRLSEEHGVRKTAGVLVAFKLTHQELANMIGTVRESVTKVLQELQEDQIIEIDKKQILVKDMDALRAMI
ncbi:Crp/Fnr family transcriptional regulator [Paenibacillus sp. P26]|nr:Crp/Fnr family transcriptional regulator [Paenibacillus sp. P26]